MKLEIVKIEKVGGDVWEDTCERYYLLGSMDFYKAILENEDWFYFVVMTKEETYYDESGDERFTEETKVIKWIEYDDYKEDIEQKLKELD